ncbi:hypothetical protein AB0M94_31545 [Streptomyces xanthochromogenes]|uniref:hypothetical protein n=1 Tax=Streptomyces xanthochromogenes TaxID=67384 RepID=UPI00341320BB
MTVLRPFVLILAVLVGTAQLALAPTAFAASATYYVDCSATTNGTGSQASPINSMPAANTLALAPGDTLLFKRGATCRGQLYARFSGTVNTPVTYGSYGPAGTAHIDANGNYAAIWLKNASYVTVQDLELTAPGDNTTARRGVWAQAVDSGDLTGVVLQRLDIHDVRGTLPAKTGGAAANGKYAGASGGIVVEALGSTTPSAFKGLRIAGNNIHRVDRAGIYFWSNWCRRPDMVGFWTSLCTADWHPHTGTVIQDNTLAGIGGDGLVVKTSSDVLVQRNDLDGFNERAGSVNAGMWTANSDWVTFQYNRSAHGNTTADGQGYDVDHSTNHVTFQYNVSFDNGGGFFLLCPYGAGVPGQSKDFVIRYNLSVNDHARTFQVCAGGLVRGQIYNNTVQLPDDAHHQIVTESDTKDGELDVAFTNNLLRGGSSPSSAQWTLNDSAFRIDHNLLYKVPVPATAASTLTSAPLLAAPSTTSYEPDAFKLLPGSPALGAGSPISGDGGRDYFGTTLATPPSIGFHEGP